MTQHECLLLIWPTEDLIPRQKSHREEPHCLDVTVFFSLYVKLLQKHCFSFLANRLKRSMVIAFFKLVKTRYKIMNACETKNFKAS